MLYIPDRGSLPVFNCNLFLRRDPLVITGECGDTSAWHGVMLILSFDASSRAKPDEAILDRNNPFVDSGASARLDG